MNNFRYEKKILFFFSDKTNGVQLVQCQREESI